MRKLQRGVNNKLQISHYLWLHFSSRNWLTKKRMFDWSLSCLGHLSAQSWKVNPYKTINCPSWMLGFISLIDLKLMAMDLIIKPGSERFYLELFWNLLLFSRFPLAQQIGLIFGHFYYKLVDDITAYVCLISYLEKNSGSPLFNVFVAKTWPSFGVAPQIVVNFSDKSAENLEHHLHNFSFTFPSIQLNSVGTSTVKNRKRQNFLLGLAMDCA